MQSCHHRFSRRQVLGLLSGLAASALAGCTPMLTSPDKEQSATPSASLPPTKVVVRATPASGPRSALWVWQKRDFIPSFNTWFAEEMQRYCGERDWTLKISEIDMPTLVSAVAANDTADLIMHSLNVGDFGERDILAPVGHIVDRLEAQWGAASASVVQDYQRDGTWWAVPYFQRSDGG